MHFRQLIPLCLIGAAVVSAHPLTREERLFLRRIRSEALGCPTGWLLSYSHNNTCYYVYDSAQVPTNSWKCAGGLLRVDAFLPELARRLSRARDSQRLREQRNQRYACFPGDISSDLITTEEIWIGMDRNTGAWLWSDGEGVFYDNWQAGEPSLEGDCSVMQRVGGKWKAADCDQRIPVVCQLYI